MKCPVAILIALGMVACQAHARIIAQDCPACSQKQLEARAKSCAQGYSYISDFPAGKFYKVCFTLNNGNRAFDWQKPEPQYQHEFDLYNNIYKLNGHRQSIHARVRVDIPADNGIAVPSSGGSSGH